MSKKLKFDVSKVLMVRKAQRVNMEEMKANRDGGRGGGMEEEVIQRLHEGKGNKRGVI